VPLALEYLDVKTRAVTNDSGNIGYSITNIFTMGKY